MNKIDIGKRIRRLRLNLDITQAELAVMAGSTQSHVGNLERGRRELTAKCAEQLASALGVSPAHLMGWDIIQ